MAHTPLCGPPTKIYTSVCESVELEAGDEETREVVSDDVIKAATKFLAVTFLADYTEQET